MRVIDNLGYSSANSALDTHIPKQCSLGQKQPKVHFIGATPITKYMKEQKFNMKFAKIETFKPKEWVILISKCYNLQDKTCIILDKFVLWIVGLNTNMVVY